MKRLLIILIFGFFNLSEARDTDNFDDTRDVISSKYVTGAYLLYDCEDQHWVCVIQETKEKCEQKRHNELKRGKHHLSCFSAEVFENYKQCTVHQQRLTSSGLNPRVCLHPEVRQRFIGFR